MRMALKLNVEICIYAGDLILKPATKVAHQIVEILQSTGNLG